MRRIGPTFDLLLRQGDSSACWCLWSRTLERVLESWCVPEGGGKCISGHGIPKFGRARPQWSTKPVTAGLSSQALDVSTSLAVL
eukprot:15413973-Alexandrium_andersonii.AAC.1